MRFSELLRLVFANLLGNKAKMLLTSLGVIVGSATIVLVIAIGQGGKADVADQFKNLNAGAIEISVGSTTQFADFDAIIGGGMPAGMEMPSGGGMPSAGAANRSASSKSSSGNRSSGGMPSGGMSFGGQNMQSFGKTTLTADDVSDIENLVDGIGAISLLQSDSVSIYGGSLDEEEDKTVVGVYPNYQYITNLSLLTGRFIEDSDNDEKSYVCVIGYNLAAECFTYPNLAYGEYLEIDGKNYEIIGVLSEMGGVSSGISPDDAVYVPYDTATKHIFGKSIAPTISAVATDVSGVSEIMKNIETVLNENHPNSAFTVKDSGSAKEAAYSSANTLSLLLLAVASIVFIVGGIGIMNVMFVSVKERTAEIGLLKAIGYSQKIILLEFLIEAAVVSIFGGIVGVLLSFGIMPLASLLGMRVEASIIGYILALVFAIVTGTVFGFYPAYKASRLVPIKALNLD